jgi:hypothetical protein
VKVGVGTAVVATTVGAISTAVVASEALLPIYAETSRPLAALPWDLLRTLIQKLGQTLSTFFGPIFGLRRKKKATHGTVFDGATTKPVVGAYVVLYSKSGNLSSTFTDKYGSFAFAPSPDTYQLKAEKIDYLFPSTLVTVPMNADFARIYRNNEEITIATKEDKFPVFGIPIDPRMDLSRTRRLVKQLEHILSYLWVKAIFPLLIVGVIVTGLSYVRVHSAYYQVLFGSFTLTAVIHSIAALFSKFRRVL